MIVLRRRVVSQGDACTLFKLNLFHFQKWNQIKYISCLWSTYSAHSTTLLKNILVKILTVQRTNCSAHALHARKKILFIMFAPCHFRRVLPTIHGRRISLRRQRPTSLCSHPFIHDACYRRLTADSFHCGVNAIVLWNLNPTMLIISAISNYTPFHHVVFA